MTERCYWPDQVAQGKCEHYCRNCGKHFLVDVCDEHSFVPAADFCSAKCFAEYRRDEVTEAVA